MTFDTRKEDWEGERWDGRIGRKGRMKRERESGRHEDGKGDRESGRHEDGKGERESGRSGLGSEDYW